MCIAALAIALVTAAGGRRPTRVVSGRDLMDPELTQHDSVRKDCLSCLAPSFTSVLHVHLGNVQDKEVEGNRHM